MKDHNVAVGVIGATSAAVANVSPQEWAAYAAIALNLLLIFRFLWRFFIKPMLLSYGLMKGKPKPFMESTSRVPLDEK